tara:strand:+ start:7240 stop:7416 length:177 start_codon:yes stop_codon:yes gene_type:complete
MSVEIHLTLDDFKSIITWYELAFGKDQAKQTVEDQNAFKKITVMCLAKMEELKDDTKE